MQEQRNACAVCNIVSHLRCGGCQYVHYCSKEHQKLHWKTHSKTCRAYKLVENSQLGRHLVATRNIKVGELVVYDKAPFITLPESQQLQRKHSLLINQSETEKSDGGYTLQLFSQPVCLSCYVELKDNDDKPCVKCGWPLCRNCTKHGTECEFTMKHHKTKVNILYTEYGQSHPAYGIIGVIRALALRENNPETYRKLMNLQGSAPVPVIFRKSIEKTARFAKIFLNIKDVEDAEICKIIQITLLNGYKVNRGDGGKYSAVYDRASFIEHDCRPNCSKSFTDEGGILFWAAVPISKGDHISTSYTSPYRGTKKRRDSLFYTKFFDCTCKRCTDPTEFGTMFNAMKCASPNCTGYALPPTFLVTGRKYGDFVCLKCKKPIPRQYSDWIETMIDLNRATLQRNIGECENFIEMCRKYLHEGNAYIFDIEVELTLAICVELSNLTHKSEEYWKKVYDLCSKLTDRLQILAPAEHVKRAAILFLKYLTAFMSGVYTSMTVDKKIESIKIYLKDLRQAEELLRREPACFLFEHQILILVRDGIQMLEIVDNMQMATSFLNSGYPSFDCVLQ